MIVAESQAERLRTRFGDGTREAYADAPAEKGGAGSGFRPHELLEAALATCVAMTVRKYADANDLPVEGIRVRVEVDRATVGETVFRHEIELDGAGLTEEQRTRLQRVAEACPVRKTLSQKIGFSSGVRP